MKEATFLNKCVLLVLIHGVAGLARQLNPQGEPKALYLAFDQHSTQIIARGFVLKKEDSYRL
jgi:hypothetical protein